MDVDFKEMLLFFQRPEVALALSQSSHGLERECLRVNKKGALSYTPHPKVFGSKLHNQYVSTDFCESQLELITPYYKTLGDAFGFLHDLHSFVYENLGEELLWPFSPPCVLPEANAIPLAYYGTSDIGRQKTLYRRGLGHRYGRKMQTLSGIHYNFSLHKDVFSLLAKERSASDQKALVNEIYFAMARNFLRTGWLNTYLFGASCAVDRSFFDRKPAELIKLDDDTLYAPYATSIRTSSLGYYSKVQSQITISYNSVQSYVRDLRLALAKAVPRFKRIGLFHRNEQIQINTNYLQSEAEAYARIRPKPSLAGGLRPVDSLDQNGVRYLEVRTVDINPFCPDGIEREQLAFLNVFMLYCLGESSPRIEFTDQKCIRENQNRVALQGRQPNLRLREKRGQLIPLKDWARRILDKMEPIATELDKIDGGQIYSRSIASALQKVEDPDRCTSAKVLSSLKDGKQSFAKFGLEQAQKHKNYFAKVELNPAVRSNLQQVAIESVKQTEQLEIHDDMWLKGYRDMEWSTQMVVREALSRGVKVEVIDRKQNLIKLQKGRKTEFVKQASMTSKDNLISYFLMENKHATKKILADAHISVPQGQMFTDSVLAKAAFAEFKDHKLVVKPNDTNYGIGISFVEPNDRRNFEKAVDKTFSLSDQVLVEHCILGIEYRFLVIAGKLVGICQRVPANVTGDGKNSITTLVTKKNADPLSYKWPEYQIQLGDVELSKLKKQGLDAESILKMGQQVFLRDNSNVSTGGDPVDVTDEVHKGYGQIALKAARVAGANFCGIDMIISDIKKAPKVSNHAILELNFNPALYLHRYPVAGKKRYVEKAVLDALGF